VRGLAKDGGAVRIKSQKDFWSGLMFTLTGAGFALGALNYTFGTSARPGPGYFPFGLGAVMALLGAFVVFESLSIDTADGDPVTRFAWKPLLTIVASIIVFGATLVSLGMALALPLLVVIASLAGDEFHWKDVLINSAVLTVGSWLVFIVALKLVIPLWPAFLGVG
jgi:putative tricarboxylic transport membrane protein